MDTLSEEELLLLNNIMYYSDSAGKKGMTLQEIALKAKALSKNYDKDSMKLSGGFESNPQQMVEIADKILQNKELCNLKVAGSTHSKGVHAVCFVDDAGNATVAVRGTGGTYEAWSDNVEGAYDTDTECQEEFLEFMDEIGQKYDDITVTGHSKGGNLAQYATIKMGDKIGKCVSFDGQGFNDEFCEIYASEIAENKHKIKSICADEDYVNILLNSIAANTVYLETVEGENAHSPYALWKKNEGMLVDGIYSETVEQNVLMKILDKIADYLVDKINSLPDYIERPLVDFLGSLVGTFFGNKTGQLTEEDILDAYMKFLNLIKPEKNNSSNKESTKGVTGVQNCNIAINCEGINNAINDLIKYEDNLNQICNRISNIKLHGNLYVMCNMKIKSLKDELDVQKCSIRALHTGLSEIRDLYINTEQQLCQI